MTSIFLTLKSVCFVLWVFTLFPQKVSGEEGLQIEAETVLNRSFENLFKTTAAGYAIYGEKPIYLGNFCPPEALMPGSPQHEDTNLGFMALKILKRDPIWQKKGDFSLVIGGCSLFEGHKLMVINRQMVRRVFKENASLFKYKLGYKTSAEEILTQLETLEKSFWELFGETPALQGILLGYGTDNSITWERSISFMDKDLYFTPKVPLYKAPDHPETREEVFARIEEIFGKDPAWRRVKEELEDFSHEPFLALKEDLRIGFTCHKNSRETKALIKSYREAKAKTDQALLSRDFLNGTLKKLGLKAPSFKFMTEDFSKMKKSSLSRALAHSIKYTFSTQISPEFIAGMKDAEKLKIEESKVSAELKELKFLEMLREIELFLIRQKGGSQRSRKFFESLDSDTNAFCLIPHKLYTKKLKKAPFSKRRLTRKDEIISVNYTIKDINGDPIGDKLASKAQLSLNSLIPGLAHGMIGMTEGEICEVSIHPDFAYGTYSKIGSGEGLRVEVELIEIKDSPENLNFPMLQPVDVKSISPEVKTCKEFKNLQKRYNYLCGLMTWLHYKKAKKLVDLGSVIKNLCAEKAAPLSEEDRESISQINWLIYQGRGPHLHFP